jgi:hypothetical protein
VIHSHRERRECRPMKIEWILNFEECARTIDWRATNLWKVEIFISICWKTMSIRLTAFERAFINFTLGTTSLQLSSLVFSIVAGPLVMLCLLHQNSFSVLTLLLAIVRYCFPMWFQWQLGYIYIYVRSNRKEYLWPQVPHFRLHFFLWQIGERKTTVTYGVNRAFLLPLNHLLTLRPTAILRFLRWIDRTSWKCLRHCVLNYFIKETQLKWKTEFETLRSF